MFIAIEGGDGTGKTLQIKLLKEYLETKGCVVYITREPGGTEGAEKIRDLVLYTEFEPKTQALLFAAARHEHLQHSIKPKLKEGIYILCDRYLLSSIVYQGMQGVDNELIMMLHKSFNENILPDHMIILDAPVDITMKRLQERHEIWGEKETIFDRGGKEFHQHVRERFLTFTNGLKKKEPARYAIINANQNPDAVHRDIIKSININGIGIRTIEHKK